MESHRRLVARRRRLGNDQYGRQIRPGRIGWKGERGRKTPCIRDGFRRQFYRWLLTIQGIVQIHPHGVGWLPALAGDGDKRSWPALGR